MAPNKKSGRSSKQKKNQKIIASVFYVQKLKGMDVVQRNEEKKLNEIISIQGVKFKLNKKKYWSKHK